MENAIKALERYNIDSREQYLAKLLLEELGVQLSEYEAGGYHCSKKHISVAKRLGSISVTFQYEGDQLNIIDSETLIAAPDDISKRILMTYGQMMSYQHRGRRNIVKIDVHRNKHKQLQITLAAIACGILVGLLMQLCVPDGVVDALNSNLLSPVTQIFLKLLKLVVAPVVLFSIMASLANISDISSYGSIGLKVVVAYMMTTVIAATLGFGFGMAIFPYVSEMPLALQATAIATDTSSQSFSGIKMLLDIFPDNIVSPISEGNMMQLLVVALLFSIAISISSEKLPMLKSFVVELNHLSGTVITLVLKFIPIMAFCSMASLFSTVRFSTMLSCVYLIATPFVGFALMGVVYILMIVFWGRTSPMPIIRSLPELAIVPVTTSSSAASLSNTISVANKIGIPARISSFSLPLGATINMDGVSFYMPPFALIFAAMAGIQLDSSTMMSLFVMSMALSIASPGIPGAAFPIMALLMQLANIPMEYFSLFVALFPLLDPIVTSENVIGDICVTHAIASASKSE